MWPISGFQTLSRAIGCSRLFAKLSRGQNPKRFMTKERYLGCRPTIHPSPLSIFIATRRALLPTAHLIVPKVFQKRKFPREPTPSPGFVATSDGSQPHGIIFVEIG